MTTAERFLGEAKARGLDFYTGVPCSFLTPLINRTISDRGIDYLGAVSEGEAVAIAAGAWLAGRGTVVMCQNSGLGNTINPLTSLNWPFRIPTLLVVTWRGQPGLKDEPQHELMGQVMDRLLDDIRIPHRAFPRSDAAIAETLAAASEAMTQTDLPFALIMEKDSVADEGLDQPPIVAVPRGTLADRRGRDDPPTRVATLERLLAAAPDAAAIITTTGKCGRELFTLADRPQHLYLVGSMGCASAMGLGVALNVARPVIVLDGDGAALMELGNLSTIGAAAPGNLVHVVLDNGVHDSTGGQATVAPNVDFAQVALACGYRSAAACNDLTGFEAALTAALAETGPALVHMTVAPGSIAKLGRPTVKPADVARRFRDFLAGA